MGDLILLTGGSGHLGFASMVEALRRGYYIRAAVRSEAKRASILNNPVIKTLILAPSQLTFAMVPDFTVPGAYDEAIKGARYAIHLASPVPSSRLGQVDDRSTYQQTYMDPAVAGTLRILEAARKSNFVRRVVITSSLSSIIHFQDYAVSPSSEVFSVYSEAKPYGHPSDCRAGFEAYSMGKAAALKAAEGFMQREKPRFDLVTLHPAYVLGRNEMATDLVRLFDGPNYFLLRPLIGDLPFPAPHIANSSVHIDDVAFAHVQALDVEAVPGNRRYMLAAEPFRWQDSLRVLERHYPRELIEKLFPNASTMNTMRVGLDRGDTQAVFRIQFQGFEEQVLDVVGQFVELIRKQEATASTGMSVKL